MCRRQQAFHALPPPSIPSPYHDSASAIRAVHSVILYSANYLLSYTIYVQTSRLITALACNYLLIMPVANL